MPKITFANQWRGRGAARGARLLAAVGLVAATACVAGSSRMPAVAPQGTLALGDEAAGRSDGPFRVVFSGPQGAAATGAELSVVFSRPLRELSLAGDEATPPIVMKPALRGRWQWVGTRALVFVPEDGRLPGATRIAVEVPSTTRALDGSSLGTAHRFELTTPRPRLVSSTPHGGATGLVPSTVIELRFNQPVDPVALEPLLRLEAKAGKSSRKIALQLTRPEPGRGKRVRVTPKQPLPVHTKFELAIAKGLVSEEGPLPSTEAQAIEFETYGPLRVERVSCDQDTPNRDCAPGGSLGVNLSNAVKMRDLKRAVSVTPPVALAFDSWRDDDDLTSYIDLNGRFRPGQTYTVRVAAGLKDRYGQALAQPFSERVRIDDLWPTVEIGVRGDTLEPSVARPITVGSVNVEAFELVSGALTPSRIAEVEALGEDEKRFAAASKWFAPKRVAPRAATNQLAKHVVDPAALLGAPRRGPVVIGTRHTARDDARRKQVVTQLKVVQVTDLALTAKLSRHGSAVWVTSLSSGKPIAGAQVEVHRGGAAVKTYVADAQGIATIPARDFSPNFYREGGDARAIIVAKHGDDWAYRPASDYLPPWRFDVPSDLSGELRSQALLFTERGIYRPGDAVLLKGIVRSETPTGSALLASRNLTLKLRSPDGEDVAARKVTTSRFGSFDARLQVPKSGALGSWQVEVEGLGERGASHYFEVAEYRPTEFKVAVESNQPSYVRSESARWTIRGDYLFGAPMAKADVRYSVTRQPTWFAPPDSEAFSTDASALYRDHDDESLGSGVLEERRDVLAADGTLKIEKVLNQPGQRGPELVMVDAEVTDVARQAVAGSTSAVVHPASFYVGVEYPKDYFVDAPGKFEARVAALSPKGQRLGGKRVRVELLRRTFTLARQDTGGGLHAVSKPVDSVVGSCEVTTTTAVASCRIDVKEGGYYIAVASAKDEGGRETRSAVTFFGIGAGKIGWGDGDTRNLELATNKKQYGVGDTARVLVKSPFTRAEALVTVERAGVYRAERVVLEGPTPTVQVKITEDLRPNAYVSVHLLRGRSAKPAPGKPDVGAPDYRLGYAELSIDPEARRLSVAVKPEKTDYKPGEKATVDVKVTDASGKPRSAEVTLYAVDEGVLSLIGYKTPDPLPVFTAARPLQVATVESREALARIGLSELGQTLGLDKGKDGGGGGESTSARRDFRQSAYFNPSLVTDATGRARVSFALPESLTTFRVMAVAASVDDRYGYGESRVVTSRRLMARPALPRFLRAGDRADLGVVVSAKDFGPATVSVKASVTGLELVGDAEQRIELGRDESKEVRFPVRAKSAGSARLFFEVKGEGERDAVEVKRRVDTPTVMEAVALYGKTAAAAGEKLGDLSKIRRDVGDLTLTASSSALVGLGGGVEQLVEYPYGCTEQLSSRLLPLLPLRDLARDFSIDLPKDADRIVEKTVAELVGRQRGDGGFGMWPDSLESSPWVSAYAHWVLHLAKQRGAAVPARVQERGRAYVRRFLERLKDDPLELATAAFVVDVLAETGAPDPGYMGRLFEARAKLPVFGKALLLHALASSDQKRTMIDELAQELEGQLTLDGNTARVKENLGDEYAVLMDSTARSSALVLRALVKAKPKHALASELARGLLAARRGGAWRSTQETAFVLLALDDYRKAEEAVVPDYAAKVWLAGKELFSAEMRGRSLSSQSSTVPASRLSAASGGMLVFQKEGEGTLFYEARLRYAKRTLPASPLDRGFYVQKTLRAVTPESLKSAMASIPELGARRVPAGSLVLADVVVVTPSPRDFVVIDDPLPAGLEAVDASLATTAAWLDVPGEGGEPGSPTCDDCDDYEDRLAHGSAFLSSWYRRELRDDRVLFFVDHMAAGMYHYRYLARATTHGVFVVPPTKAEEMYQPEVFGRTGATGLEVR